MPKRCCDHCHLTYDSAVLLEDLTFTEPKYFCCKGCQGVFHLLKDEGLESFYDKMGKQTIEPPLFPQEGVEKFDLDGFKEKYIKEKDGLYEISLIVEGIHCAACVWLNEKVLHQTEGIVEATVNGTNNKAKILWDPELIALSAIIEKIRSIGYNAYPYDPRLQEDKANAARREYYSRLLVGIFATMNIMWIAIAQYAGYFTGMRQDIKSILNFAEFVLATPTLFYTGWVYYRGAYYGLKHRFITMDFLIATGASLAYGYSIYAMFTRTGEVYFDSVTMIITFVFTGKYLEVLTKKRAVDTLDSMTGSLPTEVTVCSNNEKLLVHVNAVKEGDIIELRPGEKIVIDGVLLAGEGSFDESSLTGESEPVLKESGAIILSGSICLDSVLRYQATGTQKSSMLSKIVALLEESVGKKPRIEQLANTISGYFSLAILSIASATFIGWYVGTGVFETALIVAISVVVVACPCALGLATPVSTLVGLGVAARRGVLFKEASFLESMAKSTVLILDKTGTITEGKPRVIQEEIFCDFDRNILYSLLQSSSHPVSRGVLTYLEEKEEILQEYVLSNAKAVEAKGVEAWYGQQRVVGGNGRLMHDVGLTCNETGGTHYWFAIDGVLCAKFVLKDRPRANAKASIDKIKSLGIKVMMLTGDNAQAAMEIALEVGIDTYKHSLFPQDKAAIIDTLHEHQEVVVMAGDGINDALALSRSDIAISLGSGADVAVNVSDIVLLNDSLKSLEDAFVIARRTFAAVKQNLGFSLLYNTVTIPLAVAGYVIPLVAALSMSLSSLVVIMNAMRIKSGFKGEQR